MTIQTLVDSSGVDVFSEKLDGILPLDDNQNDVNPVLEGAEFVLKVILTQNHEVCATKLKLTSPTAYGHSASE